MILPQEIRIDNFHGPLHIHPPRDRGDPERIRERSLGAVREIIRGHAEAHDSVIFENLLEELR